MYTSSERKCSDGLVVFTTVYLSCFLFSNRIKKKKKKKGEKKLFLVSGSVLVACIFWWTFMRLFFNPLLLSASLYI